MQDDGQMTLFDVADPTTNPDVGYRAPAVQAIAGVTYRQLDYWARTDLVKPSVRAATGSGSQRLYSFHDIVVVKVIKRLLDAGVSLQQIRAAITVLHTQSDIDHLAEVTLVCDGVSIYQCLDTDEVIDLLAHGQAVIGIALGATVAEVRTSVAEHPAAAATAAAEDAHDELARRRAAKAS